MSHQRRKRYGRSFAGAGGPFAELKKHFSEDAIIEIVGVMALFGWQNRCNDTLATQLEDHPLELARQHLAVSGWTPGVQAP